MSLDLGAVVGRVILETSQFDRDYNRTLGKMRAFGASAESSAGGVRVLDRSLLGAAGSADKASVSMGRASQSAARQAAAEEKAAAAARVHSASMTQVNALMGRYAGETPRVQQATLRLVAAQERLNELQARGTATTRQLASAQAGLIGAQRALTKAQEEGAVAAGRFSGGLRSTLKMAGELGLLIGAIEIAKKAMEFVGAGKELTTALNGVQAASRATDAEMRAVRAQAIAMGKDLTIPAATAVDAADAILDLVKAGVALPKAMNEARYALLLASAASVSTADAARVLGDVMDDFSLPAEEAARVSGVLAAAANSAGGGLMDMFDAFKFVGPRARAVGIDVTDVAAALTDLAKSGLQGSIAGTGLAMALQKIAAPSAKSKEAIEDLGLTVWNAQGRFVGLGPLIDQVHQAQERMGIGSKRFLADISEAFGARAANIIAAFAAKGVAHYDEFRDKLASGDVQKYADTMNRGLSAAMAQIGKQFTAAGIDIYQKLEPALATAAMWLGTTLPHAIGVLADILGPTVHLVGTGLAGAWHVLSGVLSVAGGALGGIGHFLQDNKTVLTALATAVISMWAAYRGYRILRGVFDALGLLRVGAERAMLAVRGMGASMSSMSMTSVGMGMALVGVGAIVAAISIQHQKHAAQVAADKAAVENFTAAIQADSGALGENVRAAAAKQLSDNDMFDGARRLGITQKTLTDAVLGNASALKTAKAAMDANGKSSGMSAVQLDAFGLRLGVTSKQIVAAKVKAVDLAAATDKGTAATHAHAAAAQSDATALTWVVDAHGRLIQAESKSKGAADLATNALKAQTMASTLLKQAMDLLNGVNESLETSTDQFSISLGNLTNKTSLASNAAGKQTASLNQTTVAGATNRQMLVGLIDAAKAQAQATADQAAKHGTLERALRIGNHQLAVNEDAIRKAAKAAGMDKGEVDKLIASMGILSKVHPKPKVDADTSPAGKAITDIQARIDRIKQGKEPYLDANSVEARGVIAELEAELRQLNGRTATVYVRGVHVGAAINPNTGEAAGGGGATGGTAGEIARRGFAKGGTAGGTVVGPGSDTSDSVVIRVSRDEEIIRASQARKHRRLLKAINSGRGGFAAGGTAGFGMPLGGLAAAYQHRSTMPGPGIVQRPIQVTFMLDGRVVAERIVHPEIELALGHLADALNYGRAGS